VGIRGSRPGSSRRSGIRLAVAYRSRSVPRLGLPAAISRRPAGDLHCLLHSEGIDGQVARAVPDDRGEAGGGEEAWANRGLAVAGSGGTPQGHHKRSNYLRRFAIPGRERGRRCFGDG